ncbi:unnamed protein product [Pleuronectes platessa]|uniref:Uncharacterized protein n=1 Tax=Pleuronectes platessa TaxID=8262 RepID=A0A9N7U485_PLEPL|nr:unnamed protein product [Pleuronectes platessa]
MPSGQGALGVLIRSLVQMNGKSIVALLTSRGSLSLKRTWVLAEGIRGQGSSRNCSPWESGTLGEGPMLSVTFDLSHRKVRVVKELRINVVAWSKEELRGSLVHLLPSLLGIYNTRLASIATSIVNYSILFRLGNDSGASVLVQSGCHDADLSPLIPKHCNPSMGT